MANIKKENFCSDIYIKHFNWPLLPEEKQKSGVPETFFVTQWDAGQPSWAWQEMAMDGRKRHCPQVFGV